ncbi:MAG: SDR family NAD(P)-dependent oxidoreductase [Pseudomonadota bacterium]
MTDSTAYKPTALITGASSGIGYELARVFADKGYNLVVVARREELLAALANELAETTQVHTVVMDLSKARGPAKLFAATEAMGLQIDVLVNNAGTAYQGRFADMSQSQIHNLLALNMRGLTDTTYEYLPGMLERGQGKILNVASVVGFQAIPGLALYSASKAFVLSFSESLAEEVRCQGVQVSALCPGLTKTDLVNDLGTNQYPGSELFMSDARSVAREGYQALHAGETIRVTGLLNQLAVGWAEYQPRWLKRTLAGIAGRASFAAKT